MRLRDFSTSLAHAGSRSFSWAWFSCFLLSLPRRPAPSLKTPAGARSSGGSTAHRALLNGWRTLSAHTLAKKSWKSAPGQVVSQLVPVLVNPIVHGDGVGYYSYVRAPLIERKLDISYDSFRDQKNLGIGTSWGAESQRDVPNSKGQCGLRTHQPYRQS